MTAAVRALGLSPRLVAECEAGAGQRASHLLEAVVALVLDGYQAVLEGLDDDVAEVETQVSSTCPSCRGSTATRWPWG